MVELADADISDIRLKVNSGWDLGTVLSAFYPGATVYIVRGYDTFSDETYIKGAYFQEHSARANVMETLPNGTSPQISDSYTVICGTIEDLASTANIYRFDETDFQMIISSLGHDLRII